MSAETNWHRYCEQMTASGATDDIREGDWYYSDGHLVRCEHGNGAHMSPGERLDEIAARMSAAYAERRKHRLGSPEWAAANETLEAVYDDLRAFNAARATS